MKLFSRGGILHVARCMLSHETLPCRRVALAFPRNAWTPLETRVRPAGDNGPVAMARSIAHYEITGTLGEGGMGIVYAARDERLNRTVALKMIRRGSTDPEAAERLRREARAAATVSHPNICQLYDIGEEQGDLFIAMEYLEGESLAARLTRGPLPLNEAVQITLSTLSALDALHTRGLIHRDLKPSNIFLTPHGVKLLDFGLACGAGLDPDVTRLTMPGTVLGTPQYLPPEQLRGEPVDARGDLFAAGVVLYEMLTGRPPFSGSSMPEIAHAIVYEHPPALGGSPAVVAIDRIIHKAIAKRTQDRYPSAGTMADDLRATLLQMDSGSVAQVRPMTRLIVLPFRMLRADPEIEFLAFSLSDALTTSLSGLDSLVVRSSLTTGAFGTGDVDLQMVAAKAEVDAVLTGTLLRADDQLRVTTQLAEVPSGTILWSQTTQVKIGDVFTLQDALTNRIVESLSVPLSARDERVLKRDVPANAKAYEFYLRANQIAYESKNWRVACELYRHAVEEDPGYAPAWARLARIYRVLAMYSDDSSVDNYALAEDAFKRALELNPDLSIAHNLFTAVEVETGRAQQAMLRLLQRARSQSGDSELFAGLVQACRYAGLERPAIAAYEHARRLDPHIRTAVSHAYFMSGEYERVVETDQEDPPMLTALALDLMGRRSDAAAHLRAHILPGVPMLYRLFLDGLLGVIEGDRAAARKAADEILKLWRLRDPCATYYLTRTLASIEHPRALEMFRRAVEGGFHAYSFFIRDPWLDKIRSDRGFKAIVEVAEAGCREASLAFVAAGGERILGPVHRA
jgi:serine/threonine protein kinase/tetratricopeptide (TPR) repeat protein